MRWIAATGWLLAGIFAVLWVYAGPFGSRAPAPPVAVVPPPPGTAADPGGREDLGNPLFTLTVLKGSALPDRDDFGGRSDAYVVVEYDGEERSTSIRDGVAPVWNESFGFRFLPGVPVKVTVWDRDLLKHDLIGRGAFRPDPEKSGEIDLKLDDGGSVRIRVAFE